MLTTIKWIFAILFGLLPALFLGAGLFVAVSVFIYPRSGTAARSVDRSNIRQIGQAGLIYASDHRDKFPDAIDLPDYARLLALEGGLNDASVWVASQDHERIPSDMQTVLMKSPDGSRILDPRFASLPHSVTLVIGGLDGSHPGTTPIAWTRGLDLETGLWSPDSPYEGEGGNVVFLGGNAQFYRSLRSTEGGVLTATNGRRTHRIRDALPSNARISAELAPPKTTWSSLLSEFLARRVAPVMRDYVIPFGSLAWMTLIWVRFILGIMRGWDVLIPKLRAERTAHRFQLYWVTPVLLIGLSILFRA